MKISVALAAAAIALASLTLSTVSHAAVVGYNGDCYGNPDSAASVITAAGHTPVRVNTINAAELAPLDGFMWEPNCSSSHSAADLDAAVSNGLTLIMHWASGVQPPGGSGIVRVGPTSNDAFLPQNSPALSGPGGAIGQNSLAPVFPQGGVFELATLPLASSVIASVAGNPSQVVTAHYNYGRGRVIYSNLPLSCFLGPCTSFYASSPAIRAYATNLVAWAVPSFISCAAEGFTGSKLTMCRQVCEVAQTPTRMTSLIKLYVAIYRSEPPCSR